MLSSGSQFFRVGRAWATFLWPDAVLGWAWAYSLEARLGLDIPKHSPARAMSTPNNRCHDSLAKPTTRGERGLSPSLCIQVGRIWSRFIPEGREGAIQDLSAKRRMNRSRYHSESHWKMVCQGLHLEVTAAEWNWYQSSEKCLAKRFSSSETEHMSRGVNESDSGLDQVHQSTRQIQVWIRSMVDLEAYPTPIISMYRTQAQLDVVDMPQAWLCFWLKFHTILK